jgi:N-acetylglucosaminyldiphosphoundecaprenol N-acetyl-beta-D-mannosaminyltransferase
MKSERIGQVTNLDSRESKPVLERISAFGTKTNLTETSDYAGLVSELADNTSQSAFFCNVHMLMLSQEDPRLANAMNNADRVFADSAPVAWLQRRISGKNAMVIPGYKIMLAVCDRAKKSGERVGFLGSTPDVMNKLVQSLSARFEGLLVSYQYCPPFMEEELVLTQEEIQNLKDSDIQWLFVGLGCPKQEKWIATYGSELNCHTLGVGAAFDWLSGSIKKPPDWMERFGLAWVYRLLKNPSKMWSRYLIYNTKFLIKAGIFLIRGK